MLASDQPGCCGVAARLPKNPGTQKLTPLSSANARWEKNMIAGAKTIAATPSLRRCAEIGRPLFAAASAILAIILCPGSVSLPIKFGDIVTLEQAGLTLIQMKDKMFSWAS